VSLRACIFTKGSEALLVIQSIKQPRTVVIIAFLFAVIIGMVISAGIFLSFQIVIFVTGLFFFIWVLLKPNVGILSIVILIFIPLSLGNFLRVPYLLVAELTIPFVMLAYFLAKITKRESIFVFKKSANALLIPILLYFMIVFFNYIRTPLPPGNILGIGSELGGLRVYYEFLLCFLVYIIFADAVGRDKQILNNIFSTLWALMLILNLYGIASAYLPSLQKNLFSLQNLGIVASHSLATGSWAVSKYATGGYRSGLLHAVSPIGLLLLLSGLIRQNKFTPALLFFFWFGLILSGGRSFFIGALFASCIWMIMKKNWESILGPLLLGIVVYLALFVYYGALSGPLQRILQIRGGLEETVPWRAKVYSLFLESFKGTPLFGAGMGSVPMGGSGFERYLSGLLRFGGHGTYLSLLYTMGLLGFIPFTWILYRSIKSSIKMINYGNNSYYRPFVMFTFLFLIYYIFPLAVGGRGSDIFLFMILGIVSGLYIALKNEEKEYVTT